MSAQNINISSENVSGSCDLKCSYNFKYNESNSTAKNNGVMINLTYDNGSVAPVLYNNQKYTVSQIFIVAPSIHLFNNATVDAEIYVEHIPVNGGVNLNVSVPIISSSETSTATNLITQIIDTVAANAPSEGEETNLNISGFTLQSIIPIKPFYSYTATDNNEWIVYDVKDAIPLSSSTLSKLVEIIDPFPIPTEGYELFMNNSGPNTTELGEGIYISCKPTGSSEEETAVTYDKNDTSESFWDNSIVKMIIRVIVGCLLFVAVFYLINSSFNYIITGSVKLPSFSKTVNSSK